MRRNRRKRNNFYNQNINHKMEQKQFKITLTEKLNGSEDFEIRNQGFTEFELIGILIHVTEQRKQKLNEMMSKENLEKEME